MQRWGKAMVRVPRGALARLAVLWLVGAAVLAVGPPALAQALQLSPVMIDLLPGQLTSTLLVTNKGDRPAQLQLRPFLWGQDGNADQLTPTDRLAVSPPIGEVGPNETQTFRVVLRRPATSGEDSYRLLLDQLPTPGPAGTIAVALRFSIPVFAKSANVAAGQVAWDVSTSGGQAELVGVNHGQRHVRFSNAVLTLSSGARLTVGAGQGPYILPGKRRSWAIADGGQLRPGATCRLTATSDAGAVDATVHVSGP